MSQKKNKDLILDGNDIKNKDGKPVLTKDQIEDMVTTFAGLSKDTSFGAIDELAAKVGLDTGTKMATKISVGGVSSCLDIAIDVG
ncbi:hypothetical protein [Sporohalobacter salinus]|uniref:hypothetical protein n=1 Tax=Sporohalobacter salinus TaxID=1494606 RepID=UPI001961DB71|nr:hypothetical protein [Sporohalobacter salinus]MBM7625150.1 hypothetical protein [Sporohalobacter salinus]